MVPVNRCSYTMKWYPGKILVYNHSEIVVVTETFMIQLWQKSKVYKVF
jgi:hypothetical protein